jgi:hypothetical protein
VLPTQRMLGSPRVGDQNNVRRLELLDGVNNSDTDNGLIS